MKRKMLKSICVVMSVIMLALSLVISSFALEATKTKIDEFDGYSVHNVYVNESETVALLVLVNNDDGSVEYAVTENASDYSIISFDIFMTPLEQFDFYSVDNIIVKNDTFVLVLNSYVINGFDVDTGDYNYDIYETHFLKTEDFDTYIHTKFSGLTGDNIYYSPYEYYYLTAFDKIGDTWVYANTDYIITKETTDASYGKGVYYTSTDLENWKVNYTPETVMADAETVNSLYYSVVGNKLVIEEVRFLGDNMIYDYLDEAYVTSDFKNYTSVYSKGNSNDLSIGISYAPMNTQNSFYRLECVYEKAMEAGYGNYNTQLVKIDLKNGNKEVVSTKVDDNLVYVGTTLGDTGYLVEEDSYEHISFKYLKDNDTFAEIPLEGADKLDSFTLTGERIYAFENGSMWIIEDTDARKYDVSAIVNSDNAQNILPFTLNHKLFMLENIDDTHICVYDTNAEIGKMGDVNLDNKFSSSDALMALQSSTGLLSLDENDAYRADINKDGVVNSSDALMILQRSTGLIAQF